MLKHIQAQPGAEFYTDERCYITELVNHPALPSMSQARCRVRAGVTTQLHSLTGIQELYLIESGRGFMDDGQNPGFDVAPGDSIVIAPGHAQRIKNTGSDDLVFTVTCTPRFVPGCYVNLERGFA